MIIILLIQNNSTSQSHQDADAVASKLRKMAKGKTRAGTAWVVAVAWWILFARLLLQCLVQGVLGVLNLLR